jgi:hypothetical protein
VRSDPFRAMNRSPETGSIAYGRRRSIGHSSIRSASATSPALWVVSLDVV